MRAFLVFLITLFLIPALIITGVLGAVRTIMSEPFIVRTLEEIIMAADLQQLLHEYLAQEAELSPGQQEFIETVLPRLDLNKVLVDLSKTASSTIFAFLSGKQST